jgi:hypothetical protein
MKDAQILIACNKLMDVLLSLGTRGRSSPSTSAPGVEGTRCHLYVSLYLDMRGLAQSARGVR